MTKIHDVPIAMFVGKQDDLGTPALAKWTHDKVKPTTVFYKEYNDHDHFTSSVGKDMSFVTEVIQLLDKYNK